MLAHVLRRVGDENRRRHGPPFRLNLEVHMRYMVRLHFPTSINMAEYEALLGGLRIAIELGVKRLDVRGDSQLVVNQVMQCAASKTGSTA